MEKDDTLPSIEFDETAGLLKISGISIPENPEPVYFPLLQQVLAYVGNPAPSTTVELRFMYINTPSTRWLFHILYKLETVYVDMGRPVVVRFFYNDDDMFALGKNFQRNLSVPIDFVRV